MQVIVYWLKEIIAKLLIGLWYFILGSISFSVIYMVAYGIGMFFVILMGDPVKGMFTMMAIPMLIFVGKIVDMMIRGE